jgi:transposase
MQSTKPVKPGRVRAQFTKQFKLGAVRLLERGEKPGAQLAAELGVPRSRRYKWHKELHQKGSEGAFRGAGALPLEEPSAIERLKLELKRVTEERDILKKAAAYFAKDLK